MPSIDERVVELKFDNDNFEKNTKESMQTLDELNDALDFDGCAKSLKNLQNAGDSFQMNNVINVITAVKDRFDIAEMAIRSAVDNIVSRGMAMGENFVRSVSLDQITAGWGKYEEKTQSVQTIMAATAKDFEDTGVQMEYVNSQLEKLNWFTDETSYSFLDMVNNIGKFTSNRIALDTSVTAMQGISTWAAQSGATVSEAGRAMYNLSQALAVGSVKLMDWRSIENANMSTAEFKETVLETAVELGELTKKMDGVYKTSKGTTVSVKDFNSALSEGWFTSDVLLKSLDKYGEFTNRLYDFTELTDLGASEALRYIDQYAAGTMNINELVQETGVSAEELTKRLDRLTEKEMDLGKRAFKSAQEAKTLTDAISATKDAVSTGWMQTFEYIFGNYEEAKKVWTGLAEELYNVFAEGGNDRNAILKMWHRGIYEENEETGEMILKTAGAYDAFMEAIGNVWQGVKNIVSPISEAFDQIFGKSNVEKAESLINLTNKFRDISERFKNTFESVSDAVEDAISPVEEMVDTVAEAAKPILLTAEALDELANAVIRGDYGSGDVRRKKLEELGYSYEYIQNRVNELLGCEFRYEVAMDNMAESTEELGDAADIAKEDYKKWKREVEVPPRFSWADRIQRTFAGLFGAIDIGKEVLAGIGRVAGSVSKNLFNRLLPSIQDIADVAAKFGDKLVEIRDGIKENAAFYKFFSDTAKYINTAVNFIFDVIDKIVKRLKESKTIEAFSTAFGKLVDIFKSLTKLGWKNLHNGFESFFSTLENGSLADKVANIALGLAEFGAKKVTEALNFIFKHEGDIRSFFGIFDGGLSGAIEAISNSLKKLWGSMTGQDAQQASTGGFFDNFINAIKSDLENPNTVLGSMKKTIGQFWKNLLDSIANFKLSELPGNIFKIFSGGSLAAIVFAIAKFFMAFANGASKLSNIPKHFDDILKNVSKTLEAYQNKIKSGMILDIAKSIGILTLCVAGLALLPKEQVEQAVAALVVIMGMFGILMYIYYKMQEKPDEDDSDEWWKPIVKFIDGMKEAVEKFLKLAGIGVMLVGIASAIGILAYIFAKLDVINFKTYLKKMGLLLSLVAILVGAGILLSRFGKTMKGSTGTALKRFAQAVMIMSKALVILAGIQDGMGRALLSIFILSEILVLFAYTTEGLDGKKLTKMATGMLVLAIALTAFFVPAMLFGMNAGKVTLGALAITLLIAALLGVAAIIQYGNLDTKALVRLAFAILLLTGPMIAIGIFAKKAAVGLLIIAAAFGVMIGAGYLLAPVIEVITSASNSFLKFSIACGILAGAMYLAGVAIPALVDGLLYAGSKIVEVVAALVNAIVLFFQGLAQRANEMAIALLQTLWTLISTGLQFLATMAPQIAKFLFGILAQLLNGLCDIIRSSFGPIGISILNLLDAVFDLLWNLLIDGLTKVGEMVGGFLGKIFGFDVDLSGFKESAKEWGNSLIDLSDEIAAQAEESGGALSGLTDIFSNSEEEGHQVGVTFGTGMFSGVNDTLDGMFNGQNGSILDNLFGGQAAESAEEGGRATGEAFSSGMFDFLNGTGSGDISAQMGNFFNNEAFTTMATDSGDGVGFDFMQSLGISIGDNTDIPVTSTTEMTESVKGEADKLVDYGYSAGENFDRGLANGVDYYSYLAKDAATRAASNVAAAARRELREKSPSKVGDQIGQFFSIGIGNGIMEKAGYASDKSEDMTYGVIDNVSVMMSKIQDLMEDDDISPTITPVVDLSQVQRGADAANSLFCSRSIALAGTGYDLYSRNAEAERSLRRQLTNNSEVVGAITSLKDDISALNESIFNTDVVMYPDAVVGRIGRKMDQALGRLAVRNKR